MCPVCKEPKKTNYISSIKHWLCLNCDTEFDKNNVIYIYDELGELVELIVNNKEIASQLHQKQWSKGVCMTISV